MHLSLDKTSSMFGLTYDRIKIPAINAYLINQGFKISYPDSDHVEITSPGVFVFNGDFQNKIQDLERQARTKKATVKNVVDKNVAEKDIESCPLSWSVINGFIMALGTAAVATALALISGASCALAGGLGFAAGVTALVTYSLFQCGTQSEPDSSVNKENSFNI